jgi:hypothetical protein
MVPLNIFNIRTSDEKVEMIPIAPSGMEIHDQRLLLLSDISSANIWSQIVQPSQPATLPSTIETFRRIFPVHQYCISITQISE